MLATYVDQIVAEERMAEIEREAARLRRQSQQPDRQKTALEPRAEQPKLGRSYRRDEVDLGAGSSTSNLVGTRFDYGFTPRSFLNAFFQYIGSIEEFSTNIRFNLMYRPLSDLYLVYNDRRSTDTGETIERAFIVKLTNLISF